MTQEEYLFAFDWVIEQMKKLTKNKNADYAWATDAFKNFRLCESLWINSTEKWILVRMSDKFQRICNLIDKEWLVLDEKITDTLMDLSIYGIILLIYLQNKKNI